MYELESEMIIILGVICFILVRSIFVTIILKKQKQSSWIKETVLFLFIIYILMMISVTLLPLGIRMDGVQLDVRRSINFIPMRDIFHNIKQIGVAYDGDTAFMINLIIRNVGGNILLLMPLGVLVPLLFNRFRSNIRIFLLGFMISAAIEFLQLIEIMLGAVIRTVDIDDIICNVFGIMIGYSIYKILSILVKKYQIHSLLRVFSKTREGQ
ncbi:MULTISPECIES: VanZ family protein [Bacillus]|uniref:VanZ family protein n=1 Tax=Bacillus TaxID=1386 RepID=UPI0002D83137|nr:MULTISPECIES: VanZ family protein [Bacillus]